MEKLDLNAKFEANYCIPLWQRDEHIRYSLKRVSKRLGISDTRYSEPVAIVGFGPSLLDTWEELKDFRYIISCSGSHKFLLERGIIPTWHVEVDPRAHKIVLLGEPHRDVKYLVASCCNPEYFEYLKDFDVTLWHVFDATDDGIRLIPPGDVAITGGCDVGLRSITIAAFLGFRDLRIFGIDGCEKAGARHADKHPNEKAPKYVVEYSGREFISTPGLALAAKQVFHELDMMPLVRASFRGDGLVQEMAKTYKAPEKESLTANVIAATRPETISPEHLERNRKLHEENKNFGGFAARHADSVVNLVNTVQARTVLDYGCGKGSLGRALPFPIWEYDPAISGKEESPKPAELVCCFDVLEHVEPDRLGFVLADLRRCTKRAAYFIINTKPALKSYHDGLNTHLIQKGIDYWEKVIPSFFQVLSVTDAGGEIHFILSSLTPDVKLIVGAQDESAKGIRRLRLALSRCLSRLRSLFNSSLVRTARDIPYRSEPVTDREDVLEGEEPSRKHGIFVH